jgi:transcriptional antiterminator RfaH
VTRHQATGDPGDGEGAADAAGGRWFAVQTRPHQECGADGQLQAQGFRTFLPQIHKSVRHARKIRDVRAPLFPGYLFVHLDVGRERWRSVNGTFGVVRLVTALERPQPLPVGVVEGMERLADAAGVMRLGDGLEVGQRVEILSGPFAKMVGDLERLDGAGRVRVLLHLLGGPAPVILDRSALRAA